MTVCLHSFLTSIYRFLSASLNCFLNGPPKSYAFTSLPLQSSLYSYIVKVLSFLKGKEMPLSFIRHILRKITISKVLSTTVTIVLVAILRYVYFGGVIANPLDLTESICWAWSGAMFKLIIQYVLSEYFIKMGGDVSIDDLVWKPGKPIKAGYTSFAMEDKGKQIAGAESSSTHNASAESSSTHNASTESSSTHDASAESFYTNIDRHSSAYDAIGNISSGLGIENKQNVGAESSSTQNAGAESSSTHSNTLSPNKHSQHLTRQTADWWVMHKNGEISKEEYFARKQMLTHVTLEKIANEAAAKRLDNETRWKLDFEQIRMVEQYSPTAPERKILLSHFLKEENFLDRKKALASAQDVLNARLGSRNKFVSAMEKHKENPLGPMDIYKKDNSLTSEAIENYRKNNPLAPGAKNKLDAAMRNFKKFNLNPQTSEVIDNTSKGENKREFNEETSDKAENPESKRPRQ